MTVRCVVCGGKMPVMIGLPEGSVCVPCMVKMIKELREEKKRLYQELAQYPVSRVCPRCKQPLERDWP